jgi:hypothetical protein
MLGAATLRETRKSEFGSPPMPVATRKPASSEHPGLLAVFIMRGSHWVLGLAHILCRPTKR